VRAHAALAAAAALVLQGCAAALVQTNEPDATIYVDGRRVKPDGRVPNSVGPPHTARVLVIAKDGRKARATMSRKPWLALGAAYYFLPCLILCWNYTSPTFVPLPAPERRTSWDAPEESAWERAPGVAWEAEPTATSVPAPAPASTSASTAATPARR
jgi:hypothetical protein